MGAALKQESFNEQSGKPAGGWLARMRAAVASARGDSGLHYATTVHPCVINGERHLVYPAGLRARRPETFMELARFAVANGFRLKEDQRRDPERVERERRTRFPAILAFAAGMLAPAAYAEDAPPPPPPPDQVETAAIEEIEVLGIQESQGRPYLVEAGKRFIAGPFGEVEAILGVAAQVQAHGTVKRVSTRNITMPNRGVNEYVDRYDYTFPASCGGGTFSYYEGEGFAALGYHRGKRVVLDVLAGAAFTAPKLWGPYDQVLNANYEMQLMFGDGKKDGMGLLKASYSIGMMPVMEQRASDGYGNLYNRAIDKAAQCAAPGEGQKFAVSMSEGGQPDGG